MPHRKSHVFSPLNHTKPTLCALSRVVRFHSSLEFPPKPNAKPGFPGGSAQGIHRGLQRRGLAKHEGLDAGRVQAARLRRSVKGLTWMLNDVKNGFGKDGENAGNCGSDIHLLG